MRPDYLASDDERERVALHLRDGAAEGRLDPLELEARLAAAYAARTRSELAALVADLPPVPRTPRLAVHRSAAPALRPPASFSARLWSWAAASAAMCGVYGGLAGSRSLTSYDFLDFFWPIFPIIAGGAWVWRSRAVPAAEDRAGHHLA